MEYLSRYEIKARKDGKIEKFIVQYDPMKETQAFDNFVMEKMLEGYEVLDAKMLERPVRAKEVWDVIKLEEGCKFQPLEVKGTRIISWMEI